MPQGTFSWCSAGALAPAALLVFFALEIGAQEPARPTPRAAAPADLTGYWAAVITEDWRFRMVTAPKGDVAGVPLNAAGRKAAQTWDPAKDAAAGEQCRAYGAGGVMRLPTRLRISWDNDTTLKIETDAGQQVRVLRFGQSRAATEAAQPPERDWQGSSVPNGKRCRKVRGRHHREAEVVAEGAVAPRHAGAQRIAESRHDPNAPGLYAPERCALHRPGGPDRGRRPCERTKRRFVADCDLVARRSGEPRATLHGEHAFQA